jgi:DNA-binding NarL/FixJ family response regulator
LNDPQLASAFASNPIDTRVWRLLLVEDEPMWQQALPMLVEQGQAFKVVAVVPTINKALKAWAEVAPDGLITDWQLADGDDGLVVAHTLVNDFGLPAARVVLVSGADPASIPDHPFAFVPKSQVAQRLVETLRQGFQTVKTVEPLSIQVSPEASATTL